MKEGTEQALRDSTCPGKSLVGEKKRGKKQRRVVRSSPGRGAEKKKAKTPADHCVASDFRRRREEKGEVTW